MPEFDPPFHQVATAMKEAQVLLAKPQTDAITDGTEARSMDALSDLINLINESAQRAQQQQQQQEQAGGATAEEMAFLTRMMRASNQSGPPGMQPPSPGGTGRRQPVRRHHRPGRPSRHAATPAGRGAAAPHCQQSRRRHPEFPRRIPRRPGKLLPQRRKTPELTRQALSYLTLGEVELSWASTTSSTFITTGLAPSRKGVISITYSPS